jgi:hypothetical protein
MSLVGLVARRRVESTVGSGPIDVAAALGLGTAFISILPLRAVLVPGGITRLTSIDYLLTVELALLVMLLLAHRGVPQPTSGGSTGWPT